MYYFVYFAFVGGQRKCHSLLLHSHAKCYSSVLLLLLLLSLSSRNLSYSVGGWVRVVGSSEGMAWHGMLWVKQREMRCG